MPLPTTLLFDRLTVLPLIVAEGGLADAEILIGGDHLQPAVFVIDTVNQVMRLLEPSLDAWQYPLFPNLIPPSYDLWFEWYNHAAQATFGAFVRGKDVAAAIGEAASESLLAPWLLGGHLFRERPRQRDILHLGHFSVGIGRDGRMVPAYPLSFQNNWEREFDPVTEGEMAGFFAPLFLALSFLHDPELELVPGEAPAFAQKNWGKRHKRTLTAWREMTNAATLTDLADRYPAGTDFPQGLAASADRFQAETPPLDALATHSFYTGDVMIGIQKYPGTIQAPTLVTP
jgi:hypothetical protein